jgi:hypothetical protein
MFGCGQGIGMGLGLEKIFMRTCEPLWMACRPKFLELEYLNTHRRFTENEYNFGGLAVEC